MFRIELGAETTPICSCCGSLSHVLRGFVSDERGARAVYLAGYTEKNPDHFGTLLISLGGWGEGATPAQRKAILILVRNIEGKPQFMVGSAADCRWGDVSMMGRIMERPEALADPDIKEFWKISDEIWLADRRFSAQFE